MIKVRGRVITFTGKDFKAMKKESERLGLSMKNLCIGLLWESILRVHRQEAEAKEAKSLVS